MLPTGHIQGSATGHRLGSLRCASRVSLSGQAGGTHGPAQISAYGLLSPLSLFPLAKCTHPGSSLLARSTRNFSLMLHILKRLSLQADQAPVTQPSCSHTGLLGHQLMLEIPGETSSWPGPTAPQSRLRSRPAPPLAPLDLPGPPECLMVITSQVVQLLESAAATAQLVLITYRAGGLVEPTLHAPCTPQDRVAAGEVFPRKLGEGGREQDPRAGPAEARCGQPPRAVGGWSAARSLRELSHARAPGSPAT